MIQELTGRQGAGTDPGQPPRKTLVVSGVGMKEGGILTVLREFVTAAERLLPPDWRLVVLAHRQDLLDCTRAEVMEFPAIKASWFKRIWFELHTSRQLARELGATVWFAMHDMTPIVDVKKQYVYCHNPTPFCRPSLRALFFDRVFFVHSIIYGRIYALNIRRNAKVFVQQRWIRDQFIRRFGARNVIVSRPVLKEKIRPALAAHARQPRKRLLKWVYPTFPRHFKNIEVIGFALHLLEADPRWRGEVAVTIDGHENRYAQWLLKRFGHLRSLKLIGRQSAEQMEGLYADADGLLFSSKLETWGLPISEAQSRDLPLVVADAQYAHETVGCYGKVSFFDPDNSAALADMLLKLSLGEIEVGSTLGTVVLDENVVTGWDELVREVCN